MVTSLLSLLNSHAHRPPDEIVARLKAKGWIKGLDMPADLWDSWQADRKNVAICHVNDYHDRFEFDSSGFTARDWSIIEINGKLGSYFFMLADEYVEGQTPNPEGNPF